MIITSKCILTEGQNYSYPLVIFLVTSEGSQSFRGPRNKDLVHWLEGTVFSHVYPGRNEKAYYFFES